MLPLYDDVRDVRMACGVVVKSCDELAMIRLFDVSGEVTWKAPKRVFRHFTGSANAAVHRRDVVRQRGFRSAVDPACHDRDSNHDVHPYDTGRAANRRWSIARTRSSLVRGRR